MTTLSTGAEGLFSRDADLWFGQVARRDRARHADLLEQDLVRISKLVPSRRNFDRFAGLVKRMHMVNLSGQVVFGEGACAYPWATELSQFVEHMQEGRYRQEFRFFAHPRGSGHGMSYSSQVGELFSLFHQAWSYDD